MDTQKIVNSYVVYCYKAVNNFCISVYKAGITTILKHHTICMYVVSSLYSNSGLNSQPVMGLFTEYLYYSKWLCFSSLYNDN